MKNVWLYQVAMFPSTTLIASINHGPNEGKTYVRNWRKRVQNAGSITVLFWISPKGMATINIHSPNSDTYVTKNKGLHHSSDKISPIFHIDFPHYWNLMECHNAMVVKRLCIYLLIFFSLVRKSLFPDVKRKVYDW